MSAIPRQTVLVTGSSRGIGKAAAEKFIRNGFNVVLNCLHSEALLQEPISQIQKENPNVLGIAADLSCYEDCRRMFWRIGEHFGPVDILVNNAGISHVGLFQDMLPDQWEKLLSVNLGSVIRCSHLAIPDMIRRKKGCIINISSIWGQAGASCEAIYSASKGGVNSFTKALAKELGPCGIRVNAVSCGVIETGMNSFLQEDEKTSLRETIPLGRFGCTSEIADVVYFLASEEASYITGQIIGADGGIL